METPDRMSMLKIEGTHFATNPRTLSLLQTSKSSVDQLNDYLSHSSDSGVGQDFSGMPASRQPNQISSVGLKLPVKHVTQLGTQRGLFVPKYHVHNHSKCIMCKDCGIFFSYDAFLGHSHDKHGRKRHRPQASSLELDDENPNTQQMKTWQEFLAKIGQKASMTNLKSASNEPDNRTREHVESSNVQRLIVKRPEAPLNDENASSGGTSLSDFDKNIQETVNASERLLRETSQYLHSSTEKLRHRRQKSLRSHQLRPQVLLQSDLNSMPSSSASEQVQPVIKDAPAIPNAKRTNRRFLEKYLEKSRDSFQLLTDSMTMSSTSDSLRVEDNKTVHPQQDPMAVGGGDIRGGVAREAFLGGGGDAETLSRTSPRPTSPGKSPRGKSIMLQEHFNRNGNNSHRSTMIILVII